MKLLFRVLFLLTAFSVLSSGVIMAQAPLPPVLFQGELTIDGVTAPVGTIVVAEVDGEEVTACTVDGDIIIEGQYMLMVPNNGYIGKMVVLKVNGIVAGEHEYVSSMDTPVVELDLDVKTSSSGTSDTGSTAPGTTADSSPGLFGLGSSALIGIAVGVVVAAVVAVVAVLLIRRRKLR